LLIPFRRFTEHALDAFLRVLIQWQAWLRKAF